MTIIVFFFQAEDGIRDGHVTGVQTCALPIWILPPGSVQRATLGSGMQHSEGNHSATEPMRFIQMWIIPAERGVEPSIEQREFPEGVRRGGWLPVLVPAPGYGGQDAPSNPDAVTVHQDAAV